MAGACPDYEAEIKNLLKTHQAAADVPEESIPEAVADLIAEHYGEREPEEVADDSGQEENGEDNGEASATDEERAALAEEKLSSLKTTLIKAKQTLMDLASDSEGLAQQHEQEIAVITETWEGNKNGLSAHLKTIKAGHKAAITALKEAQKDKQKGIKAEIKALETQIPHAEFELKLLSNRGKLTLVLEDAELIGTLKERWIATEVARQLDYPIFMAVSERGGKDNSGDYKYILDEQGSLVNSRTATRRKGSLLLIRTW